MSMGKDLSSSPTRNSRPSVNLLTILCQGTKEILFVGRVRYCIRDEPEGDLIGAEVVEADDQIGFEVFSKAHNFIKKRIGEVS